ncbi:MAG: right-handed parallel beta-helix repeat-containing protein, partial [Candidatus Omnitrophica bacterium]|nr:right-handed parallel beta-helix repeat-containing protein [Candidatus Omnitrophota bacterium]
NAMIEAASGDVLLITDGVYSTTSGESFPIFLTRGVIVRAAPGAKPVIQGDGTETLMRSFIAGLINLEGLTFIGGGGSGDGGALSFRTATVTIRNCTFTGNKLTGAGGAGVYANFGEILIEDCLFLENEIETQASDDSGAGARIDNADFLLRNCRFIRNRAIGGEPNGGALFTHGDGTIEDCYFQDNYTPAWGGGLWADGANDLTIRGCDFVGNRSGYSGGGMYLFYTAARVEDCGFYANFSSETSGAGGLTLDGFRSEPHQIERCRFVGNSSLWAGGARSMRSARPEFLNCLMIGNRGFIAGGIGVDDEAYATIRYSSLSRNFTNAITVEGGATAEIHDSLFSGHPNAHVRLAGNGMNAFSVNSLFFDSEAGIFSSPTGDYTDLEALESDRQDWNDNLVGDPRFLSPVTGTWTQDATFDPDSYQTALVDESANWESNQWVGANFTINPNITQPLHYAIVSNTSNTMSIWGDSEFFSTSGIAYEIVDVRMSALSAAADVASPTGPSTDFFGNPRPVDIFDRGRDESMDEYDIGAIEIPYESPFLNPKSDINRDGRVDSKDLLLLDEAIKEESK